MFNLFRSGRVVKDIAQKCQSIEVILDRGDFDKHYLLHEIDDAIQLVRNNLDLKTKLFNIAAIVPHLLTLKAEVISRTSSPLDKQAWESILGFYKKALMEAQGVGGMVKADYSRVLAEAYFFDVSGDIAQKREEAIRYLKDTKKQLVSLHHKFQFQISLMLSHYYHSRELGNCDESIEWALRELEYAEQYFSKENQVQEWAEIQLNKSILLRDLRKRRIENNDKSAELLSEITPIFSGSISNQFVRLALETSICIANKTTSASQRAVDDARALLDGLIERIPAFKDESLEIQILLYKCIVDIEDYFSMNSERVQEVTKYLGIAQSYYNKTHGYTMVLQVLIWRMKLFCRYCALDENHYYNDILNTFNTIRALSLEKGLAKKLKEAECLLLDYYERNNRQEDLQELSSSLISSYMDDDLYQHHFVLYHSVNIQTFGTALELDKSIATLKECCEFFEKNEYDFEEARAKIKLAAIYQYMPQSKLSYKEEKAILLFEEANTCSGSTREFATRYYNAAHFYLNRRLYQKSINLFMALFCTSKAINDSVMPFDKDTYIEALILLMELYLDNGSIFESFHTLIDEHQKDIEGDNIFVETFEWIKLLRSELDISVKFEQDLRDAQNQISSKDDKQLWIQYGIGIIQEYRYFNDNSSSISQVIDLFGRVCQEAIESHEYQMAYKAVYRLASFVGKLDFCKKEQLSGANDAVSLVLQYFISKKMFNFAVATAFLKASIFTKQCDWGLAYRLFENGLKSIDKHPNYSLKDFLSDSYHQLSLVPYLAAKHEDIHRAIELFELIHANQVKSSVFKHTKIGNDKQFLKREMRQYQLSRRLMINPDLENKADALEHMDRIDRLFAKWEEGISHSLNSLSRWVFIPFMVRDKARFALIPPFGGIANTIVSEDLDFGEAFFEQLLNNKRTGLSAFLNTNNPLHEHRKWKRVITALQESLTKTIGHFISNNTKDSEAGGSHIELVIIPQSYLHDMPFSVMNDINSDSSFLNNYAISLVGSLGMLSALEVRTKNIRETPSIAFIPHAKESDNEFLDMLPIEKALCSSCFEQDKRYILSEDAIKIDVVLSTLEKANYWHFSTHGAFDFQDNSLSSIMLDRPLRLEDIVMLDSAKGLKFVTLAACSSGRTDYKFGTNMADGLAYKFIEIGASAVIGTLWDIEDISSLVLCRFYELHLTEGIEPSNALRLAQLWFKELKAKDLKHYILIKIEQGILTEENATHLLSKFTNEDLNPEEKYFSDPYWWAAFVLYGI